MRYLNVSLFAMLLAAAGLPLYIHLPRFATTELGLSLSTVGVILIGIRVLDFTQYLAGPTVGRLMAEMGAEIIKVEIAPGGDPSRGLPIAEDGRSGYFIQQRIVAGVCVSVHGKFEL